ncbi:MAG TPA: fibronectin type III domain-containing protein, partial [Gaiellaceae bacterium]|nr:fibronectin type III domain-containing protein [Gaiellaceae bacterium]
MVRRASIVLGLVALVVAALASSSSGQAPGPPGGSPPGLDKAIAAKQKHADRMLDKPGVAGIGVTLNDAGKPVIRIYKEKPDVADLPAELEGVPVDSVTTGVIEPRDHSPSHRFPRPVPIGVSAGLSGVATGTLGVRVTDGSNVYALSNNHVFAGINGASIGDAIISPGDVDGGIDPDDIIGTLAAYETIDFDGGDNTMDAAIALTSAANVGTSTPADGYGTPSPVTAPASIGMAVQKYGRTTGLQLGDVAATNVSVDVCYLVLFEFCLQEARFIGQISVSPGPFSAPGDSGSLIVTQGGNQPVALLFAGGDGLTIGSPIDAVLQRFGVAIDGSTPPDGPPGAPSSLSASPGDASVSLSWNAPSFDGNSPITGYKVYRGTSPNPTTSVAQLPVQTSYTDTGLANGTTYYYKVSALNANGEGALSGQAQATPTAIVPPSAPLPILDNFDDGFENPLSDQGRWANGVNGGEVGLYVPSVWLACSIATTCSGWRKFDQYGPDSEVYARL